MTLDNKCKENKKKYFTNFVNKNYKCSKECVVKFSEKQIRKPKTDFEK